MTKYLSALQSIRHSISGSRKKIYSENAAPPQETHGPRQMPFAAIALNYLLKLKSSARPCRARGAVRRHFLTGPVSSSDAIEALRPQSLERIVAAKAVI